MTHHEVKWMIDRDQVYGHITCTAPVGAPCRMICPKGCASWPCGEDDEHELVDSGQCNAVEWFAQMGVTDCYGGDPHEPVSGPVDVEWEPRDEWWEWSYAD